ncbi:MAG: xanthine dehydrogenase accessory factor, partial [Myxococcota bacterium]
MKVLRAAIEAAEKGRDAALVTVIGQDGSAPRAAGSRMLVCRDGDHVGTIGGGNFEHRTIDQALAAINDCVPRRYAVHLTRDLGMCCGGAMEVFIEPIPGRDHLVIYGAGHVGTATAHIAS